MKIKTFLALLLSPAALMAQSDFTVKGSAKAVKDGTKLFLVYAGNGTRVTDSTVVKGGSFEFKGVAKEVGMAQLFKNANPFVTRVDRNTIDYTSFYVEKGNVQLNSVDSLKSAVATGTPANDDNLKLKTALRKYDARDKALNDAYAKLKQDQPDFKDNLEKLTEQYMALEKEMVVDYAAFVKANPHSFITLLQLQRLIKEDAYLADVEKAYHLLPAALKESVQGKGLPDAIASAKKTAIGVVAQDFTQNDPSGKPVKLSDFKGKYVLIDFWASWCGPCRVENPNVVAAYNKFKDKNFTVLGVSLDGGTTKTTKEAWEKAVADDGLVWTQVSDLKGWSNEVSTAWGVRSIPANYLIDPSGKIIAKDLKGAKLEKVLEKTL